MLRYHLGVWPLDTSSFFSTFAVVIGTLILVHLALTLLARTQSGSALLTAVSDRFSQLSRRRGVSAVIVVLLVLGGRAALLPVLGVPEPAIMDEFSHLLLGETFAAGRFTNPTHPLWTHFETMFVIHRPTYTSVYPVAQGLILAVGILLGHPWIGVWLSVAIMCGVLCWMLQGWLPAKWALLGALLATAQLGISSYWMNSYWGGAHAAIGGALVLGALPRLRKIPRLRHSLAFALGVAMLANSRPYEGLLFTLTVISVLVVWRSPARNLKWTCLLKRLLLPVLAVLLIAAGCMTYYFWRVTGSPFRMPYELAVAEYAVAPAFVWQDLREEPVYRHLALDEFYTSLVPLYARYRSWPGAVRTTVLKMTAIAVSYLGPLMLFPIVVTAVRLKVE